MCTCVQISKIHHKFSPLGWVLDQNSVFAQVDAFIQRCKDLIEVNCHLMYLINGALTAGRLCRVDLLSLMLVDNCTSTLMLKMTGVSVSPCMYVCGFISRNPYSLSSHEARP